MTTKWRNWGGERDRDRWQPSTGLRIGHREVENWGRVNGMEKMEKGNEVGVVRGSAASRVDGKCGGGGGGGRGGLRPSRVRMGV